MRDSLRWCVSWRVEKYASDADFEAGRPFEVIDREGNTLMVGGASYLWELLIGGAVTDFSAPYLGVGDSSGSAASDTLTDLVATTNKVRKAMESTYPAHTDSTSSASAKELTFRSVFGSSDANFAWNEWGVFNAASTGRMLNRKVEALGTKASGSTWTLTVTLSLA